MSSNKFSLSFLFLLSPHSPSYLTNVTLLFFSLYTSLLLPLLPVIALSFLFFHATQPPTSLPFHHSSSCSCVSPLLPFCSPTNIKCALARWSSWSRSTEQSAGQWSLSIWRGESESSVANGGTTTWTQRLRRPRGQRRRTGSSTRHTKSWAIGGLKLQSSFLAGEPQIRIKTNINHWS